MTRESDEECLALIATIRDHAGMPFPHQITRLLGNLEARIKEACQREVCQAENARQRGQLAELGAEFVKLTGEVERLHSVCVIKDEEIASLRSELAAARQKIDAMRNDSHLTEDCPCGTESCREAWRELREAADAAQGAIRFRDVIREEVAAEVERQMPKIRARLLNSVEAGFAALEAKGPQEERWTPFRRGEATPETRAWLDEQQCRLDKLRAALEAEASSLPESPI
jgi:hypothetical protein